jgi:enoyl-CoA hydratase/carnithine racemase
MVLGCDLVVACEEASFGLPERWSAACRWTAA